jgi:hypothetical protein
MNKFYKINKVMQWIIAVMMFLLVLAIFTIWMKILVKNPLGFLLIFIVAPMWQFFKNTII